MLPSPVTSTPFSVKDILNLEQQQQQQHFHGAHLQADLEHHFHSAPCMLAAADGTQFSDGGEEDEEEEGEKLSYLNSLATADGHGDSGLCPQSYVHTVLRDSCSGPKEHEEESEVVRDRSQSKYGGGGGGGNAPTHLEQWRSARKQPTNLTSMAACPFTLWLGSSLALVNDNSAKSRCLRGSWGAGQRTR